MITDEDKAKMYIEEEIEKAKNSGNRRKYMAAIKALLKLKSGKELTKDMIEAFISKIYVYPGKRIEVIFTFTADCMEGVK